MCSRDGFTLIEVLVSLAIALLIVGSTLGLLSVSLRNEKKINETLKALPVLDTAAQYILTNPEKALEPILTLKDLPEKPVVMVKANKVDDSSLSAGLYRITIEYGGETIDFSIIIKGDQNI